MRTIDFSPLYRSFIGSDHLASQLDKAGRTAKQNSFPPYNVEVLDEQKYRISMAVAGFNRDALSIEVKENTLTVEGTLADNQSERKFMHKGISERSFARKFELGDHVNVVGADLKDGILHIDLERIVPESEKPQKITID
ncbi:Hsp20 family protein [Salinimonas chungwhensis]|uniref:Hsp20 family protein n=1 Tax=Salinimonas chungwhensis TaxID=265425 RepID=UPI00035CC38A|nr:Hsp20 family protein [Salinimonas chungwhensis]